MQTTQKHLDDLTFRIIGCAIKVHEELGPGLLESVYQKCFRHELILAGLQFETQKIVPIKYRDVALEADLRYDLLIENLIVVELKSVEGILPVHEAQVMTYMKLLEKPKGILINFDCTNIFYNGQKTRVNDLYAALPKI